MKRFGPVRIVHPSEHEYHVMVKPIGGVCNLACQYCYYLPTVEMYRQRPDWSGSFRMTDQTLELFTRQYLDRPIKEVQFAWQGGEPTLMGLDFFRKAVDLQRRYARADQTVSNALQTNGLLIDEAWCRFFRENDFLIGLSIDGPAAMHNRYRRTPAGEGSFDRTFAALRLLLKHHVEFNALVVVSQANVHDPQGVYRFLVNHGIRHIQFIPLLEYDRQTLEPYDFSITAQQYGRFLNAVFDIWFEHHIGAVFVQMFEQTLAAHMGIQPTLCVLMPTCGRALIMEHNGDLYACDHFPFPQYLRGNIHDRPLHEIVNSPEQIRFGLSKREDLPGKCVSCPFLPACGGGCLKHRIVKLPGEEKRINWFCEGYRAFFEHSFERLGAVAEAIRRGLPPTAAKDLLRSANASIVTPGATSTGRRTASGVPGRKPGRNDPCPCGSGLKYKHCCGRKL